MVIDAAQLAKKNPSHVDVPIERWGDSMRIRRLPASEQIKLVRILNTSADDDANDDAKTQHTMATTSAVIAICAVDAKGKTLFPGKQGAAKAALLPFDIQEDLCVAALELHGLGPGQDSQAVDDAKKN